ncbi:MAG TPA: hypothetical protein VMS64_35220 [Candidatus Methylomirabilis sp.]|nr:hypothetical protein [Candidatus Methylomirabilis sp.]
MKRVVWTTLVMTIVMACPHVIQAQGLECGPQIQKAQAAIDKVTDDMKGMDMMPKDQLLQVRTLLDDARMYLDGARRNCDRPEADYDKARAIGKAEAALGYATAADMLHFQFMKGGAGMPATHSMGGGSTPMGGMKGMGGTK